MGLVSSGKRIRKDRMSYVRFSETSDVYVYPTLDSIDRKFRLVCCACRLVSDTQDRWYGDFTVDSREEMVDHLLVHREAGYKVPKHPLVRLMREITGREWVGLPYG